MVPIILLSAISSITFVAVELTKLWYAPVMSLNTESGLKHIKY